MAALDSHEEEQIESLKAWWKENSNWVLGLVTVAVIVTGGWRGWQYYQHKQSSESATLYQQFAEQLASNDPKRINDAAAILMDKYAATPYAAESALVAAQVNELTGEPLRTKTQLQWVIEHASDEGLKSVAALRMAAVRVDEKDYASAMKALEGKHPAAFDALYADMKGDILSVQGKSAEAKTAYQQAYDKLDDKSPYRNLVQMKLDALGGSK
ncbi:MAG: tetratricopeptide repeat protein [Gallionella sp.]|nr:tetratricopeptide repeat protein [Gallionella sp.]MDD4947576.1 tetratricopeptide repeat protein [Gallionella sp.]MDD5613170.1 tetratricopeptide repeat protein [Gallionella sp.]